MRGAYVPSNRLAVPVGRLDVEIVVLDLYEGITESSGSQHLEHPQLHSGQPAHVHQGSVLLEQLLMQLDLSVQIVVDVPALGSIWLNLPAHYGVVVEVRVSSSELDEVIVVQQVRGVWSSHHQMDLTGDG